MHCVEVKAVSKLTYFLQLRQTYLGILHHTLIYPTAFKQSVSFKKKVYGKPTLHFTDRWFIV